VTAARESDTVETADAQSPIRIGLIHRYPVVRAGLRMLIEAWSRFEVVVEADSVAQALESMHQERPQIFVLDHDRIEEGSGLARLAHLRETAGDRIRLILLSDRNDTPTHERAVELGVTGLVYRDRKPDELRRAIECVHAGEAWIDRSLTARILTRATRRREPLSADPEAARVASLTEREREVSALVSAGMKNKEIAERLGISETTVRHHLTSIFAKCGVSSRFELIIFLYRQRSAGPRGAAQADPRAQSSP
jgi:DNA-binding NarL/FixJ family response regulator